MNHSGELKTGEAMTAEAPIQFPPRPTSSDAGSGNYELEKYRQMHSPVEMTRLDNAKSLAQARHADLLHFRQTWDGAIEPPQEVAEGQAQPRGRQKPIERAAVYPKSHILHFSVLASLVLFEGLANAYFFSKGSDLGLLGGWLQAITVSFTNVIAAFFLIGFLGSRLMTNPHRPIHMAMGAILIVATSIALIALNLTAAHFRDLLEFNAATLALGGAETTGEVLAPVTEARMNPFGFQTLEALLLFILGTTFAAIAAYKGRTFSDPILGYGGVTKRLESAARDLQKCTEAGFKDAKKMSEAELELLVEANEVLRDVNADLAGPSVRR